MKIPSYVVEIVGGTVIIRAADSKTRSLIKGLGGRWMLFPISNWSISYGSDDELAKILNLLQKEGVPFGAGKQWPPCEIFEEFRVRGLVAGKYKKIFWNKPRHFEVTER